LPNIRSRSGGTAITSVIDPISFVCRYSSSFPQNRCQPTINIVRGKSRLAKPKNPTKIQATVAP